MPLTYFPPAQTHHFTPYNQVLGAAYNFKHMDDWSFRDTIRPGQMQKRYAKKVQYTDKQNIYLLSTSSELAVTLHDAKGDELPSIAAYVFKEPYTYDYTNENGNTFTMNVFTVQFWFDSNIHPEGEYYFLCRVNYGTVDSPVYEYFKSEPVWLKEKHKGTVRITATHDTNEYDILFEQVPTGTTFTYRVPSTFMTLELASEDVVFPDQNEDLRRLYSKPYRIWNLHIGTNLFGAKGIPEYEVDKINRLLSLSRIDIEGKRYIKHDGAKVEQTAYNTLPLQTIDVQLREYMNNAAGAFEKRTSKLLTRPGIYPWAFPSFVFSDGLHTLVYSSRIFDNEAAENAFKATLETDAQNKLHAEGAFAWSGNDLLYSNAPGESYNDSITEVFTRYVQFTINVHASSSVPNRFFTFQFRNGRYVIDWGDGTAADYKASLLNLQVTATRTYATTGNKTFRMFSDDQTTEWTTGIANDTTPRTRIIAITPGTGMSSRLKAFGMWGQNFNSALNLSFLYPCSNVLESITAQANNITSIVPGWASSFASSGLTWGKLKYIMIYINAFNSAKVDEFINEMYQFCIWKPGGTLAITQTPPAAPTGASATSRGLLQSGGWTLIHN